jgi:prefoldin subunit 1
MEGNLKKQEKELTDEISSLNKKVSLVSLLTRLSDSSQSKYLEKQFNEAQAQLKDIVRFSRKVQCDRLSDDDQFHYAPK